MYKRIYYDQNNNKIYMWYVDTDGCHRKLVETPEIEYYIPDKTMKSPIVDIYGTPVKRQTSKSVYDLKDFIKNGVKTCEASLPEDMKFLHRYYKGQPDLDVNMDELQVATIDIEVDADKFPKAELAEYPINLITVHFSRQKQTVTFGTRAYTGSDESVKNYHHCANETVLLEKFITMFRKAKPDFISGWNSKSFDVPYIINRCKKLGVEKSLSPLNIYRELTSTKKKMVDDGGYEIAGLSQLDGLMLYKQFEQKKRVSYSLDAIAKLELGKQKTKVKFNRDSDKSQDEWNKFVEYNVNDVVLTVGIDEKKKYIELAVRFCYAGLIPFDKVYSSIARITGCAVRFLHDNGMVYPDPPKFHKESYPGAFVMAKKGFYKHLVNIDATSLYPTIMRFSNISPETLVVNPTEGLENLIHTPASKYFTCETPNGKFEMSGVYFRKDKKGVIPAIVEKFFNERVYWKNMQKVAGDVAKGIDVSDISKIRKMPTSDINSMVDVITNKGYTSDYCDKQQYVRKILINCFDKNTQIITANGIEMLKDVKVGDMVYSINPTSKVMELKRVDAVQVYHYSGDMCRIKNSTVDLGVTPDHNMIELPNRGRSSVIRFLKADEFCDDTKRRVIPKHLPMVNNPDSYIDIIDWISSETINNSTFYVKYPDTINDMRYVSVLLSPYGVKIRQNVNKPRTCRITEYPSLSSIKSIIDDGFDVFIKPNRGNQCGYVRVRHNTDDISALVGWYLSEGCLMTSTFKKFETSTRGITKVINIGQHKNINPLNHAEIEGLVKRASESIHGRCKYTINDTTIQFSSDIFYDFIELNFGRKYDKFINFDLCNHLNKRIMYDCMYKGDGNKACNRYTISKKYPKLLNSFVRLSTELGYYPSIRSEEGKYPVYRIVNRDTDIHIHHASGSYTKYQYNDMVYCVTVADNHTVMVGENGRFMSTGQCMYGVLGTPHFGFYNPKNAASVTAWGQTIIQFTARILNAYAKDTWHLKAKELFPEYNIKNIKSLKNDVVILIDTDSVVGDTVINTSGGDITIEQLYNESTNKREYKSNKFIGDCVDHNALSLSKDNELEFKPIKYIMKHQVKKNMYKIRVNNNEVICTEDHSVVIDRDGVLMDVSPSNIKKNDLLIFVRD